MNRAETLADPNAIRDPESVFKSPAELVVHRELGDRQKIAALETWAFNVRARVDATSEGMSAPGGAYTRDVELLRQIEKSLDALRRNG